MRIRAQYNMPTSLSFDEFYKEAAGSCTQYFKEQGLDVDPDEIWELYKKKLNEVVAEGIVPTVYDDALAVLHRLKQNGIRIAILSAHPQYNLTNEARSYGIDSLCDAIVGDQRDKTAGISNLLEELEVPISKSAYIGDTDHDMLAANRAGCSSLAVTTGYHTRERIATANPKAIYDSLTQLMHAVIA